MVGYARPLSKCTRIARVRKRDRILVKGVFMDLGMIWRAGRRRCQSVLQVMAGSGKEFK